MPPSVKVCRRHQCFLHEGASPCQLSSLAVVIRARLEENYRCLYFDSPAVIAGMRPHLESAGIEIERQVNRKRLLLLSDRGHLNRGHFDPDRMMHCLEDAYEQALDDGYEGLWASGDMNWEMGPRMDYSRLLEYERRLENFFRSHPRMSGICQYHVGKLPREAVRHGLLTHQSVFVSENLSMENPYFLEPQTYPRTAAHPVLLDAAIGRLCEP